jgi:hypothetical protein
MNPLLIYLTSRIRINSNSSNLILIRTNKTQECNRTLLIKITRTEETWWRLSNNFQMQILTWIHKCLLKWWAPLKICLLWPHLNISSLFREVCHHLLLGVNSIHRCNSHNRYYNSNHCNSSKYNREISQFKLFKRPLDLLIHLYWS